MMNTRTAFIVLSAIASLLAVGAPVEATTMEQSRADAIPWSGWWWPLRQGGIVEPLGKYDFLTGRRARDTEMQLRPLGAAAPEWGGYCGAVSAAAIMEQEPAAARAVEAAGSAVTLTIGDQKALLNACHTDDVANTYGDRYGDEVGSEDPHDLSPERLVYLLRFHLKQKGVPLVVDVEPGKPVWNYPVYAYELRCTPLDDAGGHLGDLSLLMADNDVHPDFVGVKVRRHNYCFTVRIRNGAMVMGSGNWIHQSRANHPDFAWYPYVARSANPEVEYAAVQRMIAGEPLERPEPSSLPETEPQPEAQPAPPPEPEPMPETETEAPTPPAERPEAEPAIGPDPQVPAEPPTEAVALSAMELVALVARKTSSFGLDCTIDRFDGAHYRIGQTFFVRCASERPGYLYLFHVDHHGVPTLLYPQPGDDNRVPGQITVEVPRGDPAGRFPVLGPRGIARVKAVVTSRPLALTGLQSPDANPAQAAPGGFRWHPTERRQIVGLLHEYQQRESLDREWLEGLDPQRLLGAFAQDEVVFYVEPRGGLPRAKVGRKPAREAAKP